MQNNNGNFTVDELGFIQLADIRVLAAAARGEIDLNKMARNELANRGLNLDGKWVGFKMAAALCCQPLAQNPASAGSLNGRDFA